MVTATRRIQFCAGHRVFQHESKCRNIHGHNYVLLFTAQFEKKVDALGRVMDFSVLKAKLGGGIEKYWDHGFIYYSQDPEMTSLFFGNKNYKSFTISVNPTAENMAEYLLLHVCPILFEKTGVTITRIELWETENCRAEVSLTPPEIPHA